MRYLLLFTLNLYFYKDRNWLVEVTTTQHGAPLLARVYLSSPQRWLATPANLGSVTFGHMLMHCPLLRLRQ